MSAADQFRVTGGKLQYDKILPSIFKVPHEAGNIWQLAISNVKH